MVQEIIHIGEFFLLPVEIGRSSFRYWRRQRHWHRSLFSWRIFRMVSYGQPAAWSTSWLRVVFLRLSVPFSFISACHILPDPPLRTIHCWCLLQALPEPDAGRRNPEPPRASASLPEECSPHPRLSVPGPLSPFLVIAPSGGDDEDLSASVGCMVDVPMIPAARFKGHHRCDHLTGGSVCSNSSFHQILGIPCIFFSQGKGARFFQFLQIHMIDSFPVMVVLYSIFLTDV